MRQEAIRHFLIKRGIDLLDMDLKDAEDNANEIITALINPSLSEENKRLVMDMINQLECLLTLHDAKNEICNEAC